MFKVLFADDKGRFSRNALFMVLFNFITLAGYGAMQFMAIFRATKIPEGYTAMVMTISLIVNGAYYGNKHMSVRSGGAAANATRPEPKPEGQ